MKPRPCSSVGRASERSQSGATLLKWVRIPVAAFELGTIVDEKYLATPSVVIAELSAQFVKKKNYYKCLKTKGTKR